MRRPGRASSSLAAAWNSGEMEEEDWLLESLRLYNDLHVFELQDPTRVIEWTGEKSICVAGYESRRNEILQLLLPQKLYAKENQGLCPERDFKVEHGGFSDRPVYSLKHVPETSLLVTSGPPDSALQVWRMEENESDVIKPLDSIPTAQGEGCSWAKIATASSKSAWVLHGLRINNVQVTEIDSRKTIFMAASTNTNELATLEFLDEAAILACSTKGQLFLADTRQPQSLLAVAEDAAISGALAGQSLCAGVRRSPMGSATDRPLVARLSSGGHVVLTDLRNPASPVKAAQCRVPTASPCGAEFPTVSFAPLLGERLAVSGFDGTVQVYDMRSWGPSAQEASPEFVHKGHVFSGVGDAGGPPLVTTHTWNPSKPRTLLSAASDGSLHVWDWSELLGAS
ncbi:WD repeat-containing protein 73 isoform X1 [Rhineura floridana]|uniref:WD repeat-containing protein 73 isoform X1 n=1 Tax=Rhineura floridana TaxID=261503 RepID=UPI002AC842BE|nr:WD repeat-containing protein 73 isoform X1 [Rhineura floridana]